MGRIRFRRLQRDNIKVNSLMTKMKEFHNIKELRNLKTSKSRIEDKIRYHNKKLKEFSKQQSIIAIKIAVLTQTTLLCKHF